MRKGGGKMGVSFQGVGLCEICFFLKCGLLFGISVFYECGTLRIACECVCVCVCVLFWGFLRSFHVLSFFFLIEPSGS